MAQSTESTYPLDEAGSRLLHPSMYVEASEPTVCICPEPSPLGSSGILGWNAHQCQTCARPIL